MNLRKLSLMILLILFVSLPLTGCNNNKEQPAPSKTGDNAVTQEKTPSAPGDPEKKRQQKATVLLQDIEKQARQGKVPGCDYAVKTAVLEDVLKAWGQPDKSEYLPAAKGTFVTYSGHGIVLGYNKGMQVFDIRSYDKELNVIGPSDLIRVYGKAAVTRSFDDQQMIGYVVSDEFRIRFIFPAPTKSEPDPGLDHLAILYPAGSVNSMADDPGVEW
ncbi:MAG: YjgB family protein [Deltaproteobacteria bacterium]